MKIQMQAKDKCDLVFDQLQNESAKIAVCFLVDRRNKI
jgi:hypothetical protein